MAQPIDQLAALVISDPRRLSGFKYVN